MADTTTEEKTYPSKPDENGFYYEDAGYEAMRIASKVDGDKSYRRYIGKKGQNFIVKELTARASMDIARLIASAPKDQYQQYYQAAALHKACEIDGKPMLMEDFMELPLMDWERLTICYNALNF